MLFLYSFTLFISAFLLFWIQPLFGKMILPLLGGSPSVWNTCMVFFQAVLLFGYIYAHISTKFLNVKYQAILHLILILLPLFFLPIKVPNDWEPPIFSSPIPSLLMLMAISIGVPFFIVSASAPLFQKWFASINHPSSKDPYFLYVSSNFGSMLALLSFPFLIEPNVSLVIQSRSWLALYLLFLVLVTACAAILWHSNLITGQKKDISMQQDSTLPPSIQNVVNLKQRGKWILLSFVPSSLMLSVTTYFSTDISPIPLFWVIPLTIYLLTFILVFSKRVVLPHFFMVRMMPVVVLSALVYVITVGTQTIWIMFAIHLLVFFICAMVCHGELANSRPSTKYLTEFYLFISLGGFLGGLFNTIIAPLIFKEVLEYPLGIILACLLKPNLSGNLHKKHSLSYNLIFSVLPGLTAFLLNYIFIDYLGLAKPSWFFSLVAYGIPSVYFLKHINHNIRFGLGIASIIAVYIYYSYIFFNSYETLFVTRNFFGIHTVKKSEMFMYLQQDTTTHGLQRINQLDECIPLSYYHSTGPIGQLFSAFENDKTKKHVAVFGLGTGSLSCYGNSSQLWKFYEIDPAVLFINLEKQYFTFLQNSEPDIDIVLGDGRIALKDVPDKYYDFIILDAFSSDAIPVHLLTKEALELYVNKLSKNGIIAFHVSNRWLDLKPVLGNLAINLKLFSLFWYDKYVSSLERSEGKYPSIWIIMTREKDNLKEIINDKRWQQLYGNPDLPLWTDDYSNIFSILKWN